MDRNQLVSDQLLDMIVTVYKGTSYAKVRIANEHANIVLIEKDHAILQEKDAGEAAKEEAAPGVPAFLRQDGCR